MLQELRNRAYIQTLGNFLRDKGYYRVKNCEYHCQWEEDSDCDEKGDVETLTIVFTDGSRSDIDITWMSTTEILSAACTRLNVVQRRWGHHLRECNLKTYDIAFGLESPPSFMIDAASREEARVEAQRILNGEHSGWTLEDLQERMNQAIIDQGLKILDIMEIPEENI